MAASQETAKDRKSTWNASRRAAHGDRLKFADASVAASASMSMPSTDKPVNHWAKRWASISESTPVPQPISSALRSERAPKPDASNAQAPSNTASVPIFMALSLLLTSNWRKRKVVCRSGLRIVVCIGTKLTKIILLRIPNLYCNFAKLLAL